MEVSAMKLSAVRKDIKNCCDAACEGTDIIISRKKGANVVIISEERYNALLAGNAACADAPAGAKDAKHKKNKVVKAKKVAAPEEETSCVVEPTELVKV